MQLWWIEVSNNQVLTLRATYLNAAPKKQPDYSRRHCETIVSAYNSEERSTSIVFWVRNLKGRRWRYRRSYFETGGSCEPGWVILRTACLLFGQLIWCDFMRTAAQRPKKEWGCDVGSMKYLSRRWMWMLWRCGEAWNTMTTESCGTCRVDDCVADLPVKTFLWTPQINENIRPLRY